MNLSSDNSFTAPLLVQGGGDGFDVAITGTFSGTVSVELAKSTDGPWIPTGSYDSPIVAHGEIASAWFVRAGFAAGDYTSGTADVEVY